MKNSKFLQILIFHDNFGHEFWIKLINFLFVFEMWSEMTGRSFNHCDTLPTCEVKFWFCAILDYHVIEVKYCILRLHRLWKISKNGLNVRTLIYFCFLALCEEYCFFPHHLDFYFSKKKLNLTLSTWICGIWCLILKTLVKTFVYFTF